MLSGVAAERENSRERKEGQSLPTQPSGTSLSQPLGTQAPRTKPLVRLLPPRGKKANRKAKREWPGPFFEPAYSLPLRSLNMETPLGTESPLIQPSGTEPPLNQPSGTQSSPCQPSGDQAPALLSPSQLQEVTGTVQASAPMPFFTSTVRTSSPRTQFNGIDPEIPTTTTQMEGERRTKSVQDIADDKQGVHRATVGERAVKPKDDNSNNNDAGSNEGSMALLTLGSPKTGRNKSSNEYEGLGEALDDLLKNGRIPIASRSNASPLPSLGEGDNDPNNEVDYGSSDEDYLKAFDEEHPTWLGQSGQDKDTTPKKKGNEGVLAMHDGNPQSQDAQLVTQPVRHSEDCNAQ
jgi:hypothetical protein